MKVVLDTNVLFATFATRGLCDALLGACLQSHEVMLSEHILGELQEHLAAKLKMPQSLLRAIDRLLREQSLLVEPLPLPRSACRDSNDLPVLGTAVAGSVDALVSGDADLLALRDIRGVPILSPREFYERLR